MKLIFCEQCWDVVKLTDRGMRFCECGRVYGRYLEDNVTAEVSETAISIALGNGSLEEAIEKMRIAQQVTGQYNDREDYIRIGRINYAWVRPNEGPGNPHTKVIAG